MNALAEYVSQVIDPFLSLLYPPRCLVCNTLGCGCLCEGCAAQITPIADPHCQRCGHAKSMEGGCFHCLRREPAFAKARSLGAYDGVLRHAIHIFKYRDRPQLAEPLGELLAAYARRDFIALNSLRFDFVIPVPMHSVRRRLRGYNQSERLARVLARELALPLTTDVLIRCRPTHPQVGLTGAARQNNLRDAFTVPFPAHVAGKTLLLVDDVSTTGSTLHECAATLKAGGAKRVYALTLAAG